jgi:hypothetical protein
VRGHVGSAGLFGNAQKGGWQTPIPSLKPQPTGHDESIVVVLSVD